MSLTDEARERRNQYQREWRKRNPDKVRKYQTTYWQRVIERERKGGTHE